MIWKSHRKETFEIFFNFVTLHCKSPLRKAEKKLFTLYMIHNLLYETKAIGVTILLKSHVKTGSFSMGYCKHEQKKYIISYKASVG